MTREFEEWPVWKSALSLVREVYRDVREVRDYAFQDQIKRAVISVANNIAEGAERSTNTDTSRFLDIAKGSAGEVRCMYYIALELDYVPSATAHQRIQSCREISRQLSGFAKYLRANK
jgi:four helix bundle protein